MSEQTTTGIPLSQLFQKAGLRLTPELEQLLPQFAGVHQHRSSVSEGQADILSSIILVLAQAENVALAFAAAGLQLSELNSVLGWPGEPLSSEVDLLLDEGLLEWLEELDEDRAVTVEDLAAVLIRSRPSSEKLAEILSTHAIDPAWLADVIQLTTTIDQWPRVYLAPSSQLAADREEFAHAKAKPGNFILYVSETMPEPDTGVDIVALAWVLEPVADTVEMRLHVEEEIDPPLSVYRLFASTSELTPAIFEQALRRPQILRLHKTLTDANYPGLSHEFSRSSDPTPLAVETQMLRDDAEDERDLLNRAPLAISLARFVHRIWQRENRVDDAGQQSRSSFFVHIDAPWGGGKTTFANYVARILNPLLNEEPFAEDSFIRREFGVERLDDLGPVFAADPDQAVPKHSRPPRGWLIVRFNAWQNQHLQPPWWRFYRSFKRQCQASLRAEGLAEYADKGVKRGLLAWCKRTSLLWRLRIRELRWRINNPRIAFLLWAAIISLALFYTFNAAGQVVGAWATGLASGLSFLWSLALIFAESLLPGQSGGAERLHLGADDPLERFRTHFQAMCRAMQRPILVIVDDLDRCRPAFVVDLLRGLQTILRSPRVVYLMLGDRDWVERAFEAQHEKMQNIDVGAEHSFGGRFVEKAIQMSLRLPDPAPTARTTYIKAALGVTPERTDPEALERKVRKAVRKAKDAGDIFQAAKDARIELQSDLSTTEKQVVFESRMIEAEVIKRAGSTEATERRVAHQLEGLASVLPGNPRQIKRIINALTIYQQFGLLSGLIQADEAGEQRERWLKLARWIILITEWPQTAQALAADPTLLDLARKPTRKAKKEATAQEQAALTIRSSLGAMAVIGNESNGLDVQSIEWLQELAPP